MARNDQGDYPDEPREGPGGSRWRDERQRQFRGNARRDAYRHPFSDPYEYPVTGWWPELYAPYPGMYGPRMYGRPGDWRTRYRDRGNERDLWDRASDEVASWFGDEEAQERREADHRGLGPKGYQRSDERILEDVNDNLTADAIVDASDIKASVQDCEVVLDGEVNSRGQKRRAEDCAEDVLGVRHVQNNLRIRQTRPGRIPS
ncbi:BON domain-containing protein [Lutimaribacter pacificus]|uniref:BON domain-containing protein n=1 Tax=Lutimaribacter pacificus TaxID=391948 RepID=A0A1H0LVD0_9RHOB|nr:BON domain-containing protein [Lutimaribacter pacificus]SDO72148.1 BON domain-containing protein [Lutimaribacter pacificus]SHK02766.1 BON domain-containing protein [Lutimaribacter pacificus]